MINLIKYGVYIWDVITSGLGGNGGRFSRHKTVSSSQIATVLPMLLGEKAYPPVLTLTLTADFLRERYPLQILIRSTANEETVNNYVVSLQPQTCLLGCYTGAGESWESKTMR